MKIINESKKSYHTDCKKGVVVLLLLWTIATGSKALADI